MRKGSIWKKEQTKKLKKQFVSEWEKENAVKIEGFQWNGVKNLCPLHVTPGS